MSRRISIILIYAIFLLLAINISAQPLTGTKTIGGTTPDYPTIHAAICSLNVHGTATGGVTFLLHHGVYNEPPDSLVNIQGTGANARVIFRPADTMGVIIYKSTNDTNMARYGFKFDNSDYIVFDGSHPDAPGRKFITLETPNHTCYYVFLISNGSDNCCMKNLNFQLPVNTLDPVVNTFSVCGQNDDNGNNAGCINDTVKNCSIVGGVSGIWIEGSDNSFSGWEIANNEIRDFGNLGIGVYDCSNVRIENNSIYYSSSQDCTYSEFIYGIRMYGTNLLANANWIYGLTSNTIQSISCIDAGGIGTISNVISNNMINLDPWSTGVHDMAGIYLDYGSFNVVYNTVHIGGTGIHRAFCYYHEGNSGDTLLNNIFLNERNGTGVNYCLHLQSPGTFGFSDHNLISTGGNNSTDNRFIAELVNWYLGTTTSYNSLADLRTIPGYIWDRNSSDPDVVTIFDVPDLHPRAQLPTAIEGNGTPFHGIITDFDGQARDTLHPDIGAVEGNFISPGDVFRPVINFNPLGTWNTISARPFSAYITDNVGVASDSLRKPRVYFRSSSEVIWHHAINDSSHDSTYYFTISGYPSHTLVTYYLAAQDTTGNVTTYPPNGALHNPPGGTPPPNPATYWVQPTLSGVKTVGGTNPDFATMQDAINAINSAEIGDGGVIFKLRSGEFTEPIWEFYGATDTQHPVTISVDSGAVVTYTTTSTRVDSAGIRFHTRYTTIDGSWPGDVNGKHLYIVGYGVNSNVLFCDTANHNTIRNCEIMTNNFTQVAINSYHNNYLWTHNLIGNSIINCNITGGRYGIQTYYADSTIIQNCNIVDFTICGIDLEMGVGSKVLQNNIYQATPVNNSSTGIICGASNSIIDGNRIGPLRLVQGNYIGTLNGIVSRGSNVYCNNMISLRGAQSFNVYGITSGYYETTHSKFLFNTVSLTDTSTGGNSCGYYIPDGMSTADTLIGNIIQNTRHGGPDTSYHSCIGVPSTALPAYSNYNLFWTGGVAIYNNRFLARVDSFWYGDLPEFRGSVWSSRDQNSYFHSIPFVSDTDLHIRTDVATVVESHAPHHWQVLTDFDGNIRSTPMCDIGADEGNFIPLSVNNESSGLPKEFVLAPVYPNPFNATASIQFSLPVTSNVRGEVFNLTGRKVATIMNSMYHAGLNRVQFDGSKLASGMYFVRIYAGKYTAQQKMVLLR